MKLLTILLLLLLAPVSWGQMRVERPQTPDGINYYDLAFNHFRDMIQEDEITGIDTVEVEQVNWDSIFSERTAYVKWFAKDTVYVADWEWNGNGIIAVKPCPDTIKLVIGSIDTVGWKQDTVIADTSCPDGREGCLVFHYGTYLTWKPILDTNWVELED